MDTAITRTGQSVVPKWDFGKRHQGQAGDQGSFDPGRAWTVLLKGVGLATDGVVLCNHVRTVDLKVLRAQFIEAAPPELAADVQARAATLIE